MLLCPPSLDSCGLEQLVDSSCEIGSFHTSFSSFLRLHLASFWQEGLLLSSGATVAWLTLSGHHLFFKHLTVVYEIKCISLTTLRGFLGVITQSSGLYNSHFSGNSRKKKEKSTNPDCSGDPYASVLLVWLWSTGHLQLYAFTCPLALLSLLCASYLVGIQYSLIAEKLRSWGATQHTAKASVTIC